MHLTLLKLCPLVDESAANKKKSFGFKSTSPLTLRCPRYFVNQKAQGYPLDFCLPVRFFENIFHGYVFKVKKSNGDIFIAWSRKSRSTPVLHDLPYIPLQTRYEVGLGVDFNIFEVRDVKNVETITWPWRLTLKLNIFDHNQKFIPFIEIKIQSTLRWPVNL